MLLRPTEKTSFAWIRGGERLKIAQKVGLYTLTSMFISQLDQIETDPPPATTVILSVQGIEISKFDGKKLTLLHRAKMSADR